MASRQENAHNQRVKGNQTKNKDVYLPPEIKQWVSNYYETHQNDVNLLVATAAKDQRLDVLEWLGIHVRTLVLAVCRNGETNALSWAALKGNIDLLNFLEKIGAASANDCTASKVLQYAALKGHMEVLKWLDQRNMATVANCIADDNRALRMAVMMDRHEVQHWLAERLDRQVFRTVCKEMWIKMEEDPERELKWEKWRQWQKQQEKKEMWQKQEMEWEQIEW
jgi:hypothetical protein